MIELALEAPSTQTFQGCISSLSFLVFSLPVPTPFVSPAPQPVSIGFPATISITFCPSYLMSPERGRNEYTGRYAKCWSMQG